MDNLENNYAFSAGESQNGTDNFLSEDWISLSTPIASEPFHSDKSTGVQEPVPNRNLKNKFSVKSPVMTFQLFVCLLFLLFLFVAKFFLPDVFTSIKAFYDRELSATMFSDGDFSELDYSSFFGSTNDET